MIERENGGGNGERSRAQEWRKRTCNWRHEQAGQACGSDHLISLASIGEPSILSVGRRSVHRANAETGLVDS